LNRISRRQANRLARCVSLLAIAAAIAATAGPVTVPGAANAAARPRSTQEPGRHPVITVTAGGDRTGSTSVAGLAGERFDFYAGRQGSPPSGSPTATCVTSSAGTCSVSVPVQSGGSGGTTAGYWIVQKSVPGGWFASSALDVGRGGDERAADYGRLFVANVRSDISVPIADTSNSATPASARGSLWAASRDNPVLPDKCGLNVALVFDLSGSIGSDITKLRSAGKSFVRALTGTPSSVAVYTFASHAPASKPVNSNLPLTSVATQSSADAITAKIDTLSVESGKEAGTNWDQGIWQVAASTDSYDVTLVLTDGNPTYYGPRPYGPGSATRFIEVENGMFSANALKAKGTTIISVGIGRDLHSTDNLAAISGRAPNKDYFITDFAELERLLTSLAEKNCLGTVNVIKQVIPEGHAQDDFGAAVPAAGWTFHARPSDVIPQAGVTGADGAVSFKTKTHDRQDVTLTEDVQSGYQHVSAPNGKNAICRTPGGLEVPVHDVPGSPGFTVEAKPNLIITCIVYNWTQSRPKPASVMVDKTWTINGTSYTYPNQPPDFQANLTLAPRPRHIGHPDWGTVYDGYSEDQMISIGESSVRIPAGCTDKHGGDLGDQSLSAGLNTYTVTNDVTCTARLTLVKKVRNIFPNIRPAPPTDWTLTAKDPHGTKVVEGKTGVTEEVSSGVRFVMSESHVDGYRQLVQRGARPVPGATGSWDCHQLVRAGKSGLEDFTGADGTIILAPGTHVVCTAVNVPLPARLTLVKHIEKYSGNGKATDWKLTATPLGHKNKWAPVVSGVTGSRKVTNRPIPPGVPYHLTEFGIPGYDLVLLQCFVTGTDIKLPLYFDILHAKPGQNVTCTYLNIQNPKKRKK
jgi:hypothetical protein